MERTTGVQAYYAESAQRLGRVYESVSFESVHEALLDLLPEPPARALDVGAGTGRSARCATTWVCRCGTWPSGFIPAAG